MRRFAAVLALVLLPVGIGAAQAGRSDVTSEIDRVGDVSAALVARDIGPDQWSLRLDLTDNDATMGLASGIVTAPADPAAATVFVECVTIDIAGPLDDPDAQEWVMQCFGNTRCQRRGQCPDWQALGIVRIPGHFWLPPVR